MRCVRLRATLATFSCGGFRFTIGQSCSGAVRRQKEELKLNSSGVIFSLTPGEGRCFSGHSRLSLVAGAASIPPHYMRCRRVYAFAPFPPSFAVNSAPKHQRLTALQDGSWKNVVDWLQEKGSDEKGDCAPNSSGELEPTIRRTRESAKRTPLLCERG